MGRMGKGEYQDAGVGVCSACLRNRKEAPVSGVQ